MKHFKPKNGRGFFPTWLSVGRDLRPSRLTGEKAMGPAFNVTCGSKSRGSNHQFLASRVIYCFSKLFCDF